MLATEILVNSILIDYSALCCNLPKIW